MLTRVVKAFQEFFINAESWTLTHYGLILALALLVVGLLVMSYGTIRWITFNAGRKRQLNEWRKAREKYESGKS